jgi:hypothetical protein
MNTTIKQARQKVVQATNYLNHQRYVIKLNRGYGSKVAKRVLRRACDKLERELYGFTRKEIIYKAGKHNAKLVFLGRVAANV